MTSENTASAWPGVMGGGEGLCPVVEGALDVESGVSQPPSATYCERNSGFSLSSVRRGGWVRG